MVVSYVLVSTVLKGITELAINKGMICALKTRRNFVIKYANAHQFQKKLLRCSA
jgi:hypothetical protein